jgi:hypothetical protein
MSITLWARVGDSGEYEEFSDLDKLINHFNPLSVGRVTHWINSGPGVGFTTENFHGYDFISCYWGDDNADLIRPLDNAERRRLESELVEVYL